MSLDTYYQKVFKKVREDFNYSTVQIWHVTNISDSTDAYGRATTFASGGAAFTGSIGWGKTITRKNTAGGYYSVGDCQINASLDVKTGAGVFTALDESIYLVAENVKLKIIEIVETSETNEMVITCEKLQ